MVNSTTIINGTGRALVAIVVLSLVYVASFGPATSIALRTKLSSTASQWAIYRPIPASWQIRILRIWGAADPQVLFLLNWGV